MSDQNQEQDFGNFDPNATEPSKSFKALRPGRYIMRFTGFHRGRSQKSGKDQLIFNLKALQGPSQGDCLHFVTLIDSGAGFVSAAVRSAIRPDWEGKVDLYTDDVVRRLFLGKTVICEISNKTQKGKLRANVDEIEKPNDGLLAANPDLDPQEFWSNRAFKVKSGGGGGGGGCQNDFGNYGGGGQGGGNGGGFNDDDIPF